MKVKAGKEKEYEHCKEINSHDSYSKGVIDFLEKWTSLLEKDIQNHEEAVKVIVDKADEYSHEADTEGITGFMYGCAVQIIAKYWEYGEELRKWHNKEYNYEGDGTVNPAILTIGV